MSRRDDAHLATSVWLRLMKTHNLVLKEARRSMGGRCTLPQFDVLAQLARSRDGLTFSELSGNLLVSAGNLTGIVDRLEDEGLVRRQVVAHDRRSFRILLTPAGRRRIRALAPRHRRDIGRIFAEVPAPVLRSLRALLGKTARLIEGTGPAAEAPAAGRRPAATAASKPRNGAGGVRARRAG